VCSILLHLWLPFRGLKDLKKCGRKARLLSDKICYPLAFAEPMTMIFRFKDQIRGSAGSIIDGIAI